MGFLDELIGKISKGTGATADFILPGDQRNMYMSRSQIKREDDNKKFTAYNQARQAPLARKQKKRMDSMLDQGRSFEDISNQTGLGVNEVRSIADYARPGYGVKQKTALEQGMEIAEALGTGIVDAATVIPRKVGTTFGFESDAAKQAQQSIQNSYKQGLISQEKLREEYEKLGINDVIGKKLEQDQQGNFAIKDQNVLEFGKDFTNAGIDTAGTVVPFARGATVATNGQRLMQGGRLSNTGKQLMNEGNAWMGLTTAQSAMNGQLTPEALAMNAAASYGLPFAGAGAVNTLRNTAQTTGKVANATKKEITKAARKQEESFYRAAAQDKILTRVEPHYIQPSGKQLDQGIVSQHRAAIINGNIDPIIVTQNPDKTMKILDGEHRFQAYQELGVAQVPTRVVTPGEVRMMKNGGYAKVPGTQGTLGKEKLSRFANKTVQSSDEVSNPLKKLVKEEQSRYTATTNEGRLDVSKQWLKGKSDDKAYTEVTKALENTGKATDQDVVNAIETAKRLDTKGGEENLLKATEIYETLSRTLSKKGQEVQAASLLNNRTPQGLSYKVQKDLRKAGIELTPERLKTIKGHIDKIKKLTPNTDESNFARHKLAQYVTSQIPAGTANKIINFWRAGLLTAPTTTGGNILGNTGEAVVRKGFVNPVATGVDKLISLKTGNRTMTLGGGFKDGAVEGKGKLGRFMKTGYDERNALSKYDAKELNYGDSGVGKLVGSYVNGTYRLMSVADQPFWYGARNEALSSIAKAEALNKGLKGAARKDFIADFKKNPPKAAMERATKEAKYGTFQNETTLGTAAGSLKQGLRRRSDIAGAVADFFIPFTQVPSAIATRVVKRTPIGTAEEAIKQFVKIKKGGKFDQRAMSQAIAEGSFGPAVFAAGYALANSGQLTFGFPEDSKERELWEAEGKQPYSVRVGDRWYSLNYLQPFGTLLSVGGEAANAEKEGANAGEAISRGIATAGQAVMNQSFLKGISGVLDAIDNPKQYAENYVSNTAGSVVPNFIRSFARASDPMQREQKGAVAGIQGSIPGVRQSLPEKLDMFGQSMEAKDNFLNQYINPLRPSKAREGDATVAELRRLKDIDEGVLPTAARKNTYGDLGKLTNKQVHELNSRAGKAMKAEYDKLVASDSYKQLDDATKARSLKNINSDVFGAVKHQYGIEQGFAMDTRKLSKDQKAYINGEPNSFLAKSTGSSSTEVAPTLSKNYKDTIKDFDSLSTEAKEKKLYKENDAEYRYELAKYENKKANGTLTKAERIKAEDKLVNLEIGSKFSKETRELYSLNKTQLTALIDNGEITEKQAEQIMALGDAYASAGKTNKFRDKNGNVAIRPKAKGGSRGGRRSSGGRKSTGRKGTGGKGSGRQLPSDDSTSTINLVAGLSKKVANTKVAKRQLPTGGAIRAPGIKAYKKVAKTNVSMTRRT